MPIHNPSSSAGLGQYTQYVVNKTAYVGKTYTNTAPFFTTYAAALAYLALAANDIAEIVVSPGVYNEDVNWPVNIAGLTLLIRGYGENVSLTQFNHIGVDYAANAVTHTIYVTNLRFKHTTYHGARFVIGNSARTETITFQNCLFETNDAADVGFSYAPNAAATGRINMMFVDCTFNHTNGGWCYHDTNGHNSGTVFWNCRFMMQAYFGTGNTLDNNQQFDFNRCQFDGYLQILVVTTKTTSGVYFNGCQFQSYCRYDWADAPIPVYYSQCRFWACATTAHAAGQQAYFNFANCVFRNNGANWNAVDVDAGATGAIRLYECTLLNARIMLEAGVVAAQCVVTNTTIKNPGGAECVSITGGTPGITMYNCNSDMNPNAAVVVTGAGNNFGVGV